MKYKIKNSYIYIFISLSFIFQSCSSIISKSCPYQDNEIVMSSGMTIKAINKFGSIIIEADNGCARSYTWEGETRSVVMLPRKERWYGKFGIYFPGPGNHWKEHNGITRGVLEEAQLHFSCTEEALIFLKHKSRISSTVYRDDGLVVTWDKEINSIPGNHGTLHVDVWQILINGKKPCSLPGSENDKITIEYH